MDTHLLKYYGFLVKASRGSNEMVRKEAPTSHA